MRAAIIQDGHVANIIEVESLSFLPGLVAADGAAIGDAWDGTAFVRPAPPPSTPAAPSIPEEVSMWQARAVLIEDDLLDAVNAVLAKIPDERARKLAQAKFEYSSTVRRDDPLVTTIIPQLGKTESEIDAMFVRAFAL
jgi:hypothetical protein